MRRYKMRRSSTWEESSRAAWTDGAPRWFWSNGCSVSRDAKPWPASPPSPRWSRQGGPPWHSPLDPSRSQTRGAPPPRRSPPQSGNRWCSLKWGSAPATVKHWSASEMIPGATRQHYGGCSPPCLAPPPGTSCSTARPSRPGHVWAWRPSWCRCGAPACAEWCRWRYAPSAPSPCWPQVPTRSPEAVSQCKE